MDPEILQQRAGDRLSVESSITALSEEYADEIFKLAKERLLNIRDWHTLPCSLLSAPRLTDDQGNEIHRQARQNDYFVMNASDGDGWIKLEQVKHVQDEEGSGESLIIRARPCESPHQSSGESMYYIRPSNTFMVNRSGLNITVSVWGRNEVDVSKETQAWTDGKDRRPDSTVGAIPGIARVQWRSLVNGILSTWKE